MPIDLDTLADMESLTRAYVLPRKPRTPYLAIEAIARAHAVELEELLSCFDDDEISRSVFAARLASVRQHRGNSGGAPREREAILGALAAEFDHNAALVRWYLAGADAARPRADIFQARIDAGAPLVSRPFLVELLLQRRTLAVVAQLFETPVSNLVEVQRQALGVIERIWDMLARAIRREAEEHGSGDAEVAAVEAYREREGQRVSRLFYGAAMRGTTSVEVLSSLAKTRRSQK